MNASVFIQLLDQLTDADWQAVAAGRCLQLLDDQLLATGPADAPNCLFRATSADSADAAALKQDALSRAEQLLHDYYRTHPLTPAGFKRQVSALLERHGAAAFAARPGKRPDCSLFVDGGTVVAETRDSPRHPYGAYCEVEGSLDDAAVASRVRQWLERGEAYDHYLGMNVCRYNC